MRLGLAKGEVSLEDIIYFDKVFHMDMVEFSSNNATLCTDKLTKSEQKLLGQFHTPKTIARFMAARCVVGVTKKQISILEPAAGAGVLAAALVEAILSKEELPTHIKLTMYELDERLIETLKQLSHQMRKSAKSKGFVYLYQLGTLIFY